MVPYAIGLVAALSHTAFAPPAKEAEKPVKVFILAGQ